MPAAETPAKLAGALRSAKDTKERDHHILALEGEFTKKDDREARCALFVERSGICYLGEAGRAICRGFPAIPAQVATPMAKLPR